MDGFLTEEQKNQVSFQQGFEEAQDEECEVEQLGDLRDEIMPIFEKIDMEDKEVNETKKRNFKKQATHGPVQATKQSTRIEVKIWTRQWSLRREATWRDLTRK
jgi:hypothetical protein